MSVDKNSDDAVVTLQYLNLRTNLLNGLSALSHEYATMANDMWDKSKWPETVLDRSLNLLADRKSYLLDIAKQGLSSADYAQFKDLVDNLILKYSKGIRGINEKSKTF